MSTKLKPKTDQPLVDPTLPSGPTMPPAPGDPDPAVDRIGPDSPVRQIGDVPYAAWEKKFSAGSIPSPAWRACYEAARPHTAMALAIAIKESQIGQTAPAGSNNALGIGPGRRFDHWEDGFSDWVVRLNSVAQPYVPVDLSLRRFLQIYVGGPLCPELLAHGKVCANGATAISIGLYVNQTVDRINGWLGAGPGKPPPAPGLNFGPHPWPPGFDVALLSLPPEGRGWNDVGDPDRSIPGVMVGTCNHHTGGNDDRDSVRELFGPRGGRFGEAMTDAVIDRTGRGYLLLDPWERDRRVTPWASGPASFLKGPGIPFVGRLGVTAINHRLFSVEHCHAEGQTFTDAQIDLSAKVHAVVICRERIPWDRWPINDSVGGLMVALVHRHFAPTTCPSDEWVNVVYPSWVNAVRAEARALQGGDGLPVPVFTNLKIPESVFLAHWPSNLPPDNKGPFTRHIIDVLHPTGMFPVVKERVLADDGIYLVTSGPLLRFAGGKVTEVGS